MKKAKYALAVALGFISLVAPSVRADDIVNVVVNVTFNGNSVCGSGADLCTETLNGSFLWDNTTGQPVFSSGQEVGQFTTSGPLSGFFFGGSGLHQVGFLASDWNNFTDAILVDLVAGGPPISPSFAIGSYPLITGLSQSTFFKSEALLDCQSVTCVNDFGNGAPGDIFTTSGTVLVTAPTPEPSSLLLLGTGLIGGIGTMRRRFLK